MKFSIITVCFNSENVLPKAMASLAIQNYKDYEWVVIDGASTDGTLKVAQSFSAAPSVVVSEKDNGIYDAMNKGVAKAQGDYIFFLNSDDAFHDENVLQDVSLWLDQHPDADFVYGSVVHIKGDGKWVNDFAHVGRHNIIEDYICHQAIFARRRLFADIGPFDLRFKLNADYDWIVRAFNFGARYSYIDRRIAFFSGGGMHTLDWAYLVKEREIVQLQYVGKRSLALRLLRARIERGLYRIMNGHRRGVLRLTESQQ